MGGWIKIPTLVRDKQSPSSVVVDAGLAFKNGIYSLMTPTKEKIEVAIRTLRSEGHIVEIQPDGGKTWFEIDHRMRASAEEMENLADGVYSLPELEQIFLQRRIDSTSPDELAETVINEWAMYAQAGHATDLAPEFRELADRACEFRNAAQWLDNQRRSFELIAEYANQLSSEAVLEQPSAREKASREAFLAAYKNYFSLRISRVDEVGR